MAHTIFLTGFPGFIATRLLRRLALDDNCFILLVQPSLISLARDQIREIARQTGRSVEEFELIEGDITKPDLGLTQQDVEKVKSQAEIIFHLAALYDLAIARDLALHVNVGGTRNVTQFALRLPKLRHFHYISTCYVAGKRNGLILETELQHNAGFRNHYEESKYLAELEVEGLKRELPITIHRPAVVCGDSLTGETAKYDGVYYLIHYLLRAPRLLSPLNIGNDQVSLNLVPVDFVVDALAALALDENAVGKTLQIADAHPLTTRELFDAISCSIIGHPSTIVVPARIVEFTLMLPPSPRITKLPHHAVPYFFLKQTYDSSQAQALLNAHQIRCPPFTSYVDKIVAFAAGHPVLNFKFEISDFRSQI
jgi:thioester reductase-like protein